MAPCQSNESGDITASKMGDLSHALTERQPARAELTAACGVTEAAASGPSPLRRRPYLQKLGPRSVDVVWSTDAGFAEPTEIQLSLPDGRPVTRTPAEVDTTARPPGGAIQWQASLAGLSPDTVYCYDVSTGSQSLRRGALRTAPDAGSGRPVRFVAIGDSGTGSADQQAVLEQLETVPFDFMVHLGDIAYGSGTRNELQAFFFDVYADVLELFPMFPASGNHEYETEDALPFREAFALPENGGPGGHERWYSYDWGDVHFVVLDSERVGAEQAAWLDADLATNRLPWTIVYLHRPPFSSGEHGSDIGVKNTFVPLFAKHKVELVLAGHDHHYERTLPQDGVTYIVTGGGGRGTRPVGQKAFTAFSEQVCHFLYVTLEGDALTVHAIDGVGQEFDSVKIHQH